MSSEKAASQSVRIFLGGSLQHQKYFKFSSDVNDNLIIIIAFQTTYNP